MSAQIVRGQAGVTKFEGTFNHVAIVVRDAQKSAKTFGEVFGIEVPPVRTIRGVLFSA